MHFAVPDALCCVGVGFALALGGRRVSKTGRQLSELGGGAASDAGVHPISGVVPVLMDKHIIPPISHLPTRRVKQMVGSGEPASLTAAEEEVKKERLSFLSAECFCTIRILRKVSTFYRGHASST